jgi:hypothetical protein
MISAAATIEKVCSQHDNIAAYIDGEMLPREEIEFEMHTAVCKQCNEELNEQKTLLQALDFALEDKKGIELPDNFTRVVVTNAESRVSGLRRPQERFKALFICAALFLLALLGLGGETKTVFETFARFAEQFLAVGGFVWNLVYDVAVGTAIILRSLSHQIVFNSNFSLAVLIGFLLVFLVFLPRFMTRFNRP